MVLMVVLILLNPTAPKLTFKKTKLCVEKVKFESPVMHPTNIPATEYPVTEEKTSQTERGCLRQRTPIIPPFFEGPVITASLYELNMLEAAVQGIATPTSPPAL